MDPPIPSLPTDPRVTSRPTPISQFLWAHPRMSCPVMRGISMWDIGWATTETGAWPVSPKGRQTLSCLIHVLGSRSRREVLCCGHFSCTLWPPVWHQSLCVEDWRYYSLAVITIMLNIYIFTTSSVLSRFRTYKCSFLLENNWYTTLRPCRITPLLSPSSLECSSSFPATATTPTKLLE